MLYDNFDIFVGFLWLIDLGVGLVFLLFIFQFTTFLYSKISIKINLKILLYLSFFVFLSLVYLFNTTILLNLTLNDLYYLHPFLIFWYDYFILNNSIFKSELAVLREIYFFNNSFEFILINFFLLYGIFSVINFFFLIKKILLVKSYQNIKNSFTFKSKTSSLFIRSQNFIEQQESRPLLNLLSKNDSKKNFFKNIR